MRLLWTLLFSLSISTGLQSQVVRFAVIGDYGIAGQPELDVANLVKGWNPDFVITLGDNNYEQGAASTIDQNIGQYYHEFISPYTGIYGEGDTINRFFPSLGNHDWNTPGAVPYLNYFALPGNERYYDFVRGDVHFFALDSDSHEPDGNSSGSVQAQWLHSKLDSATSRWKIAYFHHPPYSSGSRHGSSTVMQWPFKAWGVHAVLAGHEHFYERLYQDSVTYFVNGLGGKQIYTFGTTLAASQFRYNANFGAMLIQADSERLDFRFYSRTGILIDFYSLPGRDSCAMRVSAGWNLISIPPGGGLTAKTDLFPTALSPAFRFSADVGYVEVDSLQSGVGYWIKLPVAECVAVPGTPGDVDTIALSEGWNLIGSVGNSIDVNSIAESPPGLLASSFYEYGAGYNTTDTLRSGRGYWIKSNSAGVIMLGTASK